MFKKSEAKKEIHKYPGIIFPKGAIFDLKKEFKQDLPVILELGSGSGKFIKGIIEYFEERGEKYNYIIVEIKEERLLNVYKKFPKLIQESRIKFLQEDVAKLDIIKLKNEIDKIFLVCPDPWPKYRHQKNRLTHLDFLTQYSQILKKRGALYFKTDNSELFEWSLFQFKKIKEFQVEVLKNDFWWTQIQSDYEERYLKEGKKMYYLEVIKR